MTTLRISDDVAFPRDTVTQTLVVYGGKGMGKTNLGAVLAEELAGAHLRFAAIDPMGNWNGLRHSADGKGDGLEVLILGGRHGDLPIEPTAGVVVADLVADESVNVIVDISRRANGTMWSKGEKIRFVADYCTRLYERQGERMRPLMQIIDEAARYCPQLIPHGSPELARCVGAIEQLVEEGRNVGVGITLLTQRSARLNKSVAELAECMIAFRTIGPNSVEAILDWLGEHVPKSQWKEKVEALRKLPRGTALVISPGWLEYEGLAAIRHRSTFDTSATPTAGKERRAAGQGARPDLGKYRERMAATIEKAKAEDPKALRARIAQLEGELKKAAAAKPMAVPTASKTSKPEDREQLRALAGELGRLRKALEAAMKFLITVSTHNFDVAGIDKAELEQAVQAAIDRAVKLVDERLVARGRELTKLRAQAEQLATALAKVKTDRTVEIAVDVTRNEPFTLAAPRPARPARPGGAQPIEGGLPSGEQKILAAITQHGDRGVTREQLTVLTGYRKSTRNRYLQYLTKKELIAEAGDRITTTGAGLDQLGDDYQPLPIGDALRAHWQKTLPEGEAKLLKLIGDAYPNAVEREQLSEATGYQKSTRNRYIQYLQARRLVTTERTGVRASEELFG
jgi:uncharacterized membrane protein